MGKGKGGKGGGGPAPAADKKAGGGAKGATDQKAGVKEAPGAKGGKKGIILFTDLQKNPI
ncbi:unnamed protein product [Acanthoscelides obtectus]|uniref:Uncharacterized protein n=1 Tax=Acanthoscelides obtectus TaxID=200917 RepID=A0A9P0LHJ6_ACAOB|nr:unnamed protein product [Acanthoscelides obtectus]CAK1637934.1 hypothetical protein AOBTE_LOCUS10299 [Acanthoscelides obtectus]